MQATIWVRNLPCDTTPREVHNMMRFNADYVGGELLDDPSGGSRPFAFLVLRTHQAAVSAARLLDGVTDFDPVDPSVVLSAGVYGDEPDTPSPEQPQPGNAKRRRRQPAAQQTEPQRKLCCRGLTQADELQATAHFQAYQGYSSIRFRFLPRKTGLCFVDFVDETAAMACLNDAAAHPLSFSGARTVRDLGAGSCVLERARA